MATGNITAEFAEGRGDDRDRWRGLVLFGANTQSYKFALAEVLLDVAGTSRTEIKLEDIALPFAKEICHHLLTADRQGTARSSQLIDSYRRYNRDDLSDSELHEVTMKLGFQYVLDRFHQLDGEQLKPFYQMEGSGSGRSLVLSDAMLELATDESARNLRAEADARWLLVESAWQAGISRSTLAVEYDPVSQRLFGPARLRRPNGITGVREAISGYQKGHCFYCFESILIAPDHPRQAEVDHFLPYALGKAGEAFRDINGVWNLVLSCWNCNRDKSARIPAAGYLARLSKRNEFYVASHHPLSGTIIAQTGTTAGQRDEFLNGKWQSAASLRPSTRWTVDQHGEAQF